MRRRIRAGLPAALAATLAGTLLVVTAPSATAAPPSSTPGDTTVSIEIGTSEVTLNKKGVGKVELTCPTTEVSGPCHGQVKLKTREKFQFGGRNNLALLAAKRYVLATGASTTVKLALGDAELRLVEKHRSARKIWIQVSVLDSAGNRAVPLKKAKLLLP